MTIENVVFHVIVDHAQKSFFINGADRSNGIWLHYEMNRVAPERGKTLRDFDIRAPSQEAALLELQSSPALRASSTPGNHTTDQLIFETTLGTADRGYKGQFSGQT